MMDRGIWPKLIERYADGREICNCRHAYLTKCGTVTMASGEVIRNYPICKYGCQSNQTIAQEEIAKKMAIELFGDNI